MTMNNIINKLLLAGDKFTTEMHLKKPGFTFSASGLFKKQNKNTKQEYKTGDSK